MKSHAAVAAVLLGRERGSAFGEEFVRSVLSDLETSSLPDNEKALLRFVDKVNADSQHIGPADIQTLHSAGWNDESIYYAVTVCALFNFYNRWIDATGVHALSDEAHRHGAVRSADSGYVRK
jgi:alkylhydroperoxidase family enzyme